MIRRVASVIGSITLMAWAFAPLHGFASAVQAPSSIIITELQTTGATASEEFIELYNTTDQDIDLGDTVHSGAHVWKLQFFSSTKVTLSGFNWDPKTSGLTTVSLARSDGLANVIAAHSYFIISSAPGGVPYTPGGVDPDMTYSSGHMSDTGGGVQLVEVSGSGTTQVISARDHVGWYKPTATAPLPTGFNQTPVPAGSLQRTVNQTDNSYFDVSQMLLPMTGIATISPKEAVTPTTEPPSTVDETTTSDDQTQDVTTPPQDVETSDPQTHEVADNPAQPVMINELLPNPTTPQTDAADEYVELYNPNDQPVDLSGYTIQTGSTYSYSFTIQDQTIPAGGFLVFTSGNTNLALSNSGGQARLLDTSGAVVSVVAPYETAAEGQAWAWLNGAWQWTLTSTIGAANVLTLPIAPEVKAATTTKKANTTAAKTASKQTVTKPKPAVKAAKSTNNTVAQTFQETPEVAQLHPSALASVAVLAVGYGAYEYKQDITNRLRKLRADRAARRALSPKP